MIGRMLSGITKEKKNSTSEIASQSHATDTGAVQVQRTGHAMQCTKKGETIYRRHHNTFLKEINMMRETVTSIQTEVSDLRVNQAL